MCEVVSITNYVILNLRCKMLQFKNFSFSSKYSNIQLKVNLFDATANLLKKATIWTKQNLQMVRNKSVNILKIVICSCVVLTIVQHDTQNLIADNTIIAIAAVATADYPSAKEGTMKQKALKKKGQSGLLKKEIIEATMKKTAGVRRLRLATKLGEITAERRHWKIVMHLCRKARRVSAQIHRMKRSRDTEFTIKKRKLLNRARQRLRRRIVAVVWKAQLHKTSEGRRHVRSMKRATRANAFIATSTRRSPRVKGYRFKKKARKGGRSVEVRYYKGYRLSLKKTLGIKPTFKQSWYQLRRLRLTKGLSDTQDTQRVQKQMTLTKREHKILKKNRERDARHGAWQTHWKYARTKYLYGRRVINPTKRKGLVRGVKSRTRVLRARKLTIHKICEYVFTHRQLPPLTEKKRQQLAWMLPDLIIAVNKLQRKWKQIQNYCAKLPYWILAVVRKKMKEELERAALYACEKMSRKLAQKWKTEILPARRARGAGNVVPAQVLLLLNNKERKFARRVHNAKPHSLQGLRSRYKKLKSIRSTLQQRPSSLQEITREAIEAILEGGVITPAHQTAKLVNALTLSSSSANISVAAEKGTPFGDLPATEETIRALQHSTEDFRSFSEQSTTLLAHNYANFPDFRDSFLGGEDRAWFAVWPKNEIVGLPSLTREEKLYGAVVSRKATATKDKSFWLVQADSWWTRKWNRELLDTEVEGDFERAFSTGVMEGESFRYLELTSQLLAASIGREERARLNKSEDCQAENSQRQFRLISLLPQVAEPSSSASGLARRQTLLVRLQQLRGVWAKQLLRARLRAMEQFARTTLGRNWNEHLRFAQRLLRQLTTQELQNSAITPKFYATFVTEGQSIWTLCPPETETCQLARQLLAQQIRQLARRAWTTSNVAKSQFIDNTPLRQRQAETNRSTLLTELARKYAERQQERNLLLPAATSGNKINLKAAIRKIKDFTKMEDLTNEKRALLSERSRNFALRLRGVEMVTTAAEQEKGVIANFKQTLQQGALSLLIGQSIAMEATQFTNRTQLRVPNQHINSSKELAQWGGSYLQTRTQTPRTLQGLRSLLLPPELLWNTEKWLHKTTVVTLENSSRPARVNLHPTLFHSVINDRRQNRIVRNLQQRRLRLGRSDYNEASTHRRRQNRFTPRIQMINSVVNREEGKESLKSITQKRAKSLLRARARRFATPKRVNMSTNASSFASRRHFALKSAQSNLRARKQEATLPAWTPHYPAHYLQRALQQQAGMGVIGGAESRKAQASRRRSREDRLRHGKPVRAEKAETVASLITKKKEMLSAQGYARTRAVHILKTSRTRWWKPLARPLPFVSAMYRRPIANWNYQQIKYTRPGAARPGDVTHFAPAKELLFFSKNKARAPKRIEHLLIKTGGTLAPWATRLQKRVQSALLERTRDSHLSVAFAAKAIRAVVQQTDNVLRTRAQVLPRWERADALIADTKMIRLPQKYWKVPRNDKQCQFVPHIDVPAEAILAGMKKRRAPLARIDKMRKHLLSITNEHTLRHYQHEYRKVLHVLQPRLEKAQRAATLAALTPLQREKIQSRYWPKDELLPNGARVPVAPAISIGAEAQLFGDQVLEQYRPLFKFLLSEENMIFADSGKYRSVYDTVPVEDWTPEAYTEYVKWHVLKGNVPWLTESTLDEYRTRFEEETKDLATWRHSKDLPKTLYEAVVRSREQTARSGSATKNSRFLLTSRRERRLFEESLAHGGSVASGAWLQYNRRAAELANTQLFVAAYRRLSSRLWIGFEGKKTEITATLFALFCQWTAFQSFAAVGPEFSYALINQATAFLTQALSSCKEENAFLLSNGEEALEFERRVRARLGRFWKARHLPKVQQKTGGPVDDFLHPDNSGVYREWLVNTARYLKYTQTLFTAPTYGPKEIPTSVNFDRPRARFIGAGREEGSYESFLHAFVRQTASSRFRRVSPLRFLAIFPEGSEDYQQNLFTIEQSRSMRRRRYLAQKLSQIAYFSPAWREVLTFRANSSVETGAQKTEPAITNTTFPSQYGEPSRGNTKRRFASLPVQLVFEERREIELVERNKLLFPNRAQNVEVLRQALEERANELDFLNFQQAAGARRLPNDMPVSEQEYMEELEDATDDKRIAFLSAWDEDELEEREAEIRFWGFTGYEGFALSSQDLTSTGLTAYQDEPFTFTEEKPYRDAWISSGFSTVLLQNKEISVSHLGEKRPVTSAPEDVEAHELELTSTAATEEAVLVTGEHRARREARKVAHSKRRGTFLTEKRGRFKKGVLLYAEKTARRLVQKAVGMISKNKIGAVTNRTLQLRSRKEIVPDYNRSKYRRRRFAAAKRVERDLSVSERSATATRYNVNRAIAQFVENPFTSSKITPLTFETKPENYIDPELNEVASDEVIKSDFYQGELKLAAQYLETVGLYLPRLISFLISRRAKKENLTLAQVKGLVLATYWSVRVYLSTDDLGATLKAADKHYFRLQRNKNVVTNWAEEQEYSRVSRYNLRQRLQPAEVLSAPNSAYFNGDWLRWAFPTYHELYQEDARKYGKMLIDLRHIEKIIPNTAGVANSRTKRGTTSLDRRAFYLYTLPRARSNPHFETVLRTIRRKVPEFSATEHVIKENEEWATTNMPWIALYRNRSHAIMARKPSRQKRLSAQRLGKTITRRWLTRGTPSLLENFRHLQLSSKLTETVFKVFNLSPFARLNFFARGAHTATTRTFGQIASFVNRSGRLLRDAEYEHSAYEKLVARAYIKEHTVARNATGYVAGIDDELEGGSLCALSTNMVRQKSPRSRQYLVRHNYGAKIYREELLQQYARYRRLAEEGITGGALIRSERKILGCTLTTAKQHDELDLAALSREEIAVRRMLSALRGPKREVIEQHAREKERNFPNREQTVFQSSLVKGAALVAKEWRGRLRTLLTVTTEQTLQNLRHVGGATFILLNTRGFRRAATRTMVINVPQEPMIASKGVVTRKVVSARAQRKIREGWVVAWLNRRLQRICKVSMLKKEEKVGWLLHLAQTVRARASSAWKKLTSRLPGPWKGRKSAEGGAAAMAVNYGSLQTLEDAETGTIVKEFTYFTNETFALIRAEEARLEEIVFLENEAVGNTNFDHSREELFSSLTSLVAKKLRRARHWLRFFKRSIKDSWLHGMVSFYANSVEEFGWAAVQESRAKFMDITSAEKSMSVEDREKRKWAQQRVNTKIVEIEKKPTATLIPAGQFVDVNKIKRRLHDVKQMTWKERSDTFYRSWQKYNRVLYGAFAFASEEKLRIRWLEGELFSRAIYSTNHGEFRRHHMPSEQKRFKRGHLVRRHLYAVRNRSVMMKRKRRHQMRRMNMRLHLELFGLRNVRAANKTFKKLRRQTRPKGGAFTRLQKGLMTRLSCVLMQLNLAPTAWWSRTIARYGVVRVNGKVIRSPKYQVKKGALLSIDYTRLADYKHWLTPPNEDTEEIGQGGERWSLTGHTENIVSNRGTDLFLYKGPATEEELTPSGRLRADLFRAAALDSNKMSRRTFCTSTRL